MNPADIVVPSHGGQLRSLARQFGVDPEQLIDFSASVSPYPPPEQVLERLQRSAADSKFLSVYPDLENDDLKNAISVYASVPKESIAIANGITSLLEAALRTLGLRRCLVLQPSFSGYARSLKAAQVETAALALLPSEDFAVSMERLSEVIEVLDKKRCDSLLLANPHSPSGVMTSPSVLRSLCQQAADAGVTVLLDEAFVDFEPESTLCSGAPQRDNLVVFRSLTKFFAIPALRVAYAVASAKVAGAISRSIAEWPVGSLASVAAVELMQCRDHHLTVRKRNLIERGDLLQFVRELGLTVFPSSTNYLLVHVGDERTGLAVWRSLIVDHGVVLRCCQNFAGLDAGYLRFGVRTRDENHALKHALRAVCAGQLPGSEPIVITTSRALAVGG